MSKKFLVSKAAMFRWFYLAAESTMSKQFNLATEQQCVDSSTRLPKLQH